MGGAYGTYGRDEERTQGLCRANLEKNTPRKDPGGQRKILLK